MLPCNIFMLFIDKLMCVSAMKHDITLLCMTWYYNFAYNYTLQIYILLHFVTYGQKDKIKFCNNSLMYFLYLTHIARKENDLIFRCQSKEITSNILFQSYIALDLNHILGSITKAILYMKFPLNSDWTSVLWLNMLLFSILLSQKYMKFTSVHLWNQYLKFVRNLSQCIVNISSGILFSKSLRKEIFIVKFPAVSLFTWNPHGFHLKWTWKHTLLVPHLWLVSGILVEIHGHEGHIMRYIYGRFCKDTVSNLLSERACLIVKMKVKLCLQKSTIKVREKLSKIMPILFRNIELRKVIGPLICMCVNRSAWHFLKMHIRPTLILLGRLST